MERLGPGQPEQPVPPDVQLPPRAEQPGQLREPQGGELKPGEAVALPLGPATPEIHLEVLPQQREDGEQAASGYTQQGSTGETHPRSGALPEPEQATQQITSGDLSLAEVVALPQKRRKRAATLLTPEEQMQKAEQQRMNRNESMKRYYRRLKERAAQGDTVAQGILDRQKAAIRANTRRWIKEHPEQHLQNVRNWKRSERGKQYDRDYHRQRYAQKKAQQPPAE